MRPSNGEPFVVMERSERETNNVLGVYDKNGTRVAAFRDVGLEQSIVPGMFRVMRKGVLIGHVHVKSTQIREEWLAE